MMSSIRSSRTASTSARWGRVALAAVLLSAAASMSVGCGDNATARPPSSADVPAGSAATPAFVRGAPSAATSAVATAAVSAEPAASSAASASAVASAEPAASASAEVVADEAPLPDVEIANIGMHIGGEDNTAEQKRPIRADVGKHYDDMRRCYAKADKPSKDTTFGVDMLIPRKGGLAKIMKPRSGFKEREVKECLVEVFKKVEFRPSKQRIPLMVSFSVRFRRK